MKGFMAHEAQVRDTSTAVVDDMGIVGSEATELRADELPLTDFGLSIIEVAERDILQTDSADLVIEPHFIQFIKDVSVGEIADDRFCRLQGHVRGSHSAFVMDTNAKFS